MSAAVRRVLRISREDRPFPPISESYFQAPRVLTWKWWLRGGGDGVSREGIFFPHELTSLWSCIVLLNFYSFLSNPGHVIQSIPFVCRSVNRTSARHWDYIPSFTFSPVHTGRCFLEGHRTVIDNPEFRACASEVPATLSFLLLPPRCSSIGANHHIPGSEYSYFLETCFLTYAHSKPLGYMLLFSSYKLGNQGSGKSSKCCNHDWKQGWYDPKAHNPSTSFTGR